MSETGARSLLRLPAFSRDARVNALIGSGHFLSHYYQLCLPPMFIVWQREFGVSFAELGLALALMSATTAVVQSPIGFLVDRYGARRFLIGGTLVMTLSIAAMGLATAFWQIALLGMLGGIGNSVIHPADYAILSASVNPERIGRSFSLHTFVGHVGFAAAPPVTAALTLLIGWRQTLLLVGLIGIPVVLSIIWQSRILLEVRGEQRRRRSSFVESTRFLFSRSILLFFGFFMVSSMAGAGIQSWLITVLHRSHGVARSRVFGADRLHDRHDERRPARRLGRRPHRQASGFRRRADGARRRGDAAGRPRRPAAIRHHRGVVRRRADDRRQPHAARCHGQGRRTAGRDRQSVRVYQLRPVARRRDHAGVLRLPD
jgi:hypothetical protein